MLRIVDSPRGFLRPITDSSPIAPRSCDLLQDQHRVVVACPRHEDLSALSMLDGSPPPSSEDFIARVRRGPDASPRGPEHGESSDHRVGGFAFVLPGGQARLMKART